MLSSSLDRVVVELVLHCCGWLQNEKRLAPPCVPYKSQWLTPIHDDQQHQTLLPVMLLRTTVLPCLPLLTIPHRYTQKKEQRADKQIRVHWRWSNKQKVDLDEGCFLHSFLCLQQCRIAAVIYHKGLDVNYSFITKLLCIMHWQEEVSTYIVATKTCYRLLFFFFLISSSGFCNAEFHMFGQAFRIEYLSGHSQNTMSTWMITSNHVDFKYNSRLGDYQLQFSRHWLLS